MQRLAALKLTVVSARIASQMEANLLSSLVSGSLHSRCILIEDCLLRGGRPLVNAFIQRHLRNGQRRVHVLCCESPWPADSSDQPGLEVHDYYSDQRGWLADHDEGSLCTADFLEVVRPASEKEECVVVIDSLSHVIFSKGWVQCYRDLHALVAGANLLQLICLLHGDLLLDRQSMIQKLRHLAMTYVHLESSVTGTALAHICHRKQGGKTVKKVEEYHIDSCQHVTSSEVERPQVAVALPADLQQLTTFKLGLAPHEEEARSQLVLPYLRHDCQAGGGQIVYEPDAADDWDEEDPDDDLDV